MKQWLKDRVSYISQVIESYPTPDEIVITPEPTYVTNADGSITVSVTMLANLGYSQEYTINISKSVIEKALSGSPTDLIALNANGTKGLSNTTNGTYGAWFDSKGNTNHWGNDSHVYIEANDMFVWAYGCHPDFCRKGDTHTVTMQYNKGKKAVNVTVTFTIN